MKDSINEVKERLLEELDNEERTLEEKEKIIECVSKLERLELEHERNEADAMMKEHQKKRDKLDLKLKYLIDFVKYLLGMGFSWLVVMLILHFEEDGSVTSFGGRQSLTKLLSKWLFK